MKLEPMKPAPPVTRIVFGMRNVPGFRGRHAPPRPSQAKHLIVIKKDGINPRPPFKCVTYTIYGGVAAIPRTRQEPTSSRYPGLVPGATRGLLSCSPFRAAALADGHSSRAVLLGRRRH